jgi:hypothetical protein
MTNGSKKKSRRGTEKRRLSKLVTVRYSPAEHDDLSERASKAGLTIPSLIREITLSKEKRQTRSTRRPPFERALAAQLLGQLGRVGGNLHQLVRRTNYGLDIERAELAEVMIDMRTFRAELMAALGRKVR